MSAVKSKEILVVDDDPDILSLVALVLEGEGYRVSTASDGRAALEVVERGMPSLIVLDMRMAGMDGWQFAREFRARYNGSAPILAFTATDDARNRAAKIQAEGWIGKPFAVEDLIRTVDRHVADRR